MRLHKVKKENLIHFYLAIILITFLLVTFSDDITWAFILGPSSIPYIFGFLLYSDSKITMILAICYDCLAVLFFFYSCAVAILKRKHQFFSYFLIVDLIVCVLMFAYGVFNIGFVYILNSPELLFGIVLSLIFSYLFNST